MKCTFSNPYWRAKERETDDQQDMEMITITELEEDR